MSEHVQNLLNSGNSVQRYLIQYNNLRSRIGADKYITVYEGNDDIKVYDIWIRKAQAIDGFEPMQVKGKYNTLKLAKLIESSPEVGKDRVLLFVDYDFDGDLGDNLPERVYITDAYSIENHLVNKEVFDRILMTDFGLVGESMTFRKPLVDKFESIKNQFNLIAIHLNAYMRWLRLDASTRTCFPDKICGMVQVRLDDVTPLLEVSIKGISEWLRATAIPSQEQFDVHLNYLKELDLDLHGRGKLLLDFFRRFLISVFEDCRADEPRYFPQPNRSIVDPSTDLLRKAATYSIPPASLIDFLTRMSQAFCED